MCNIYHSFIFQLLSHQTGLELFSVQHSAQRGSPLQLGADFHKKTDEPKTVSNLLFKDRNSPATDEESSLRHVRTPNKGSNSPKNGLPESFSASIRRDAENEMEEYLLKFGGVSSVDTVSGSPRAHLAEDNENDGDDEGASMDSAL